ncbi:MAG: hypothetical protein ACI9BD_000473 [Candidatus Marinamargulisbacteria bacterium]|jgi:hypothetical protein
MSVQAAGASPQHASNVNQSQNAAKQEAQKIDEAIQFIKQDLNELSDESTGGQSASGRDVKGKKDGDSASATTQKEQPGKPQTAEQVDEAAKAMSAASQTADEVEKKKRKERKFEEKLAELAQLEGQIEVEEMNTEEKGVIAEFFDNMSKIKKLKRQLKQLDKQTDHFQQILDQDEKSNSKK